MFKYFISILLRPKDTIEKIIQSDIKIKSIILFLLWVGAFRGILEVVWIFAINHRLMELSVLSKRFEWYLVEPGPFVLANVFTAYLRWAMYSLTFYLSLRLFNIREDFYKILKVFCIVLGLYLLTIVINFIHIFLGLNMVQFYISRLYAPLYGVGQAVSSCLLVWIIYQFGRNYRLDRIASLLTAILVVGSETIFYFLSAWVYFKLPLMKFLPHKSIFYFANHLTCLVSVLLTFLFLRIGYKINGQRKTNI